MTGMTAQEADVIWWGFIVFDVRFDMVCTCLTIC